MKWNCLQFNLARIQLFYLYTYTECVILTLGDGSVTLTVCIWWKFYSKESSVRILYINFICGMPCTCQKWSTQVNRQNESLTSIGLIYTICCTFSHIQYSIVFDYIPHFDLLKSKYIELNTRYSIIECKVKQSVSLLKLIESLSIFFPAL